MRVIIDTNIWLSSLLSKIVNNKVEQIISNHEIILLTSSELLMELSDVMSRPKFEKYFSPKIAQEVLTLILERSENIEIKSQLELCRDPNDNFLLSICVDGNADFLITGDKDLLVLTSVEKTKIVDLTYFAENHLL